VEPSALFEALLSIAEEVGMRVDRLSSRGLEDGMAPPASARCRLRGETWVMLAPGDPVARWVEVLAEGLREVAGPDLEARYLPPAVREAIFPEGSEG
jgi:hypothetical protein